MITNPVKAIRAKCLDCNYTSQEVDLCPCKDCALWPFRHGKNPYRAKRVMSEEQKKAATERLAKARRKLND
jgi:hypothetical protein